MEPTEVEKLQQAKNSLMNGKAYYQFSVLHITNGWPDTSIESRATPGLEKT